MTTENWILTAKGNVYLCTERGNSCTFEDVFNSSDGYLDTLDCSLAPDDVRLAVLRTASPAIPAIRALLPLLCALYLLIELIAGMPGPENDPPHDRAGRAPVIQDRPPRAPDHSHRDPPARPPEPQGPAMKLTREQRSQRARVAALARWSRQDTRTAMEPARRAFLARFEAAVPESVTDPAARRVCAERALRSHMTGLALKSSRVRSARAARATTP